MSLDSNKLYYGNANIRERDLVTETERVLVQVGRDPVVQAGNMLWYEGRCIPTGGSRPPCIFEADLHLRKQDETSDTLLVTESGQGAFETRGGYGISGDYVVWASDMVGELTLYQISTGARKVLSIPYTSARHPLIDGNLVVWLNQEKEHEYSLKVYDISNGNVLTLPNPARVAIQPHALIGQRLIYTTGDVRSLTGDLFLLDLGLSGSR
jgi:hypothetical protein